MDDLNEAIEETVDEAQVITVPIDATLSNSGEAADAKAVGDALAAKADKTELQTAVQVNGQSADNQGLILVTAEDIAMDENDETTVKEAIENIDGKTAEGIKISSEENAETIAEAIQGIDEKTAVDILMTTGDSQTISQAIKLVKKDISSLSETVSGFNDKTGEDIPYAEGSTETIREHVDALEDATVKSVNENLPDENGNVELDVVPYAENLKTDDMQQIDGEFIRRVSGGAAASLSDGDAWILRLKGGRIHEGYVAESLTARAIAIPRTAPAAITASLDEETFLQTVATAGTYTITYGTEGWNLDPADYGITVSNTPIEGDVITVVYDGENSPEMTVSAAARTAPSPIRVTIDRDVFVEYVSESGTINLYYTTEWSAEPALYGVTVENDPVSGDQIQIVYVKEVRGTITTANFTRLVGTGWNLYESGNGYARVLDYSDTYGYRIGGSYSAIHWSETAEGEEQELTPNENGLFQIPGDGYIHVTDGDATTYILMTWSDWTGGYTGDFETYKESAVDLSAIMAACFPYGLTRVGDTRDEIDLNDKVAISRIERLAYSAANLQAAEESGRDYEYDEDYIYLVRAAPVTTDITCETGYTISEHGVEFFDGTAVKVYAEILYGTNLKDKLRRLNAEMIPMSASDDTSIKEAIAKLQSEAGPFMFRMDADDGHLYMDYDGTYDADKWSVSSTGHLIYTF